MNDNMNIAFEERTKKFKKCDLKYI